MITSIKKNLIIRGIELKQMDLDGGCQASYLGNNLKVFGGIKGEIVDVEVVSKDIDFEYSHSSFDSNEILIDAEFEFIQSDE